MRDGIGSSPPPRFGSVRRTRTLLPVALAPGLICWLLAIGPLSAQTPAPAPPASPLAVPPASDEPLAEELLRSIQEFRQLQNQVPELNLPSANNRAGEDPYQQRLRSIQQRMELIRSLVQQRQQAEAAKQRSAGETASAAGNTSNPGSQTRPNQAEGMVGSGTAAPLSAAPDFPMPELAPGPASEPPTPAPETGPKFLGQTVIPAAVDPLELANSLFQTGNYELALKTYLAIADKLDRPQDALWTEYFIASCRRITGDLPNAERGYRSLVESRRPTRPVEAARWWLDNLERRKNIKSTLDQMDAYLEAVAQELTNNGK
jgi:hypothetical protein